MAETLSPAELGRATLARQMLLERDRAPVATAVERLGALQAQEPRPPFTALWARVAGFTPEKLTKALRDRRVVRGTLMRATLHVTSARDYAAIRPALGAVMDHAMHSALKGRMEGLDLEKVLPAARKLLAGEPRTFNELRAALARKFPRVNERALGYAVRTQLPLVMVPTDDPWGFPREARFALADEWLEKSVPDTGSPQGLVKRYLGAFGPASAADLQTWSGVRGARDVLDGMRSRLVAFEDERGRELFDLPRAPRPPADVPAPPRFLPEFDSLLLAHDDRSRLIADEHRGRLVTKNLRVRATFLWDGMACGTWAVERKRDRATLVVEPFERLPKRAAKELAEEGEALLRFLQGDALSFSARVG